VAVPQADEVERMSGLQTVVRRHVDLDLTMIEASGPLSTESAPELLAELLACAAECPSSLVVDLSGCDLESPAALAGLGDVGRAGEALPSVDIVLVAADARLRSTPPAVLDGVGLFDRSGDALASAARHRSQHRMVRLDFDPVAGAPAQARDLVRTACLEWDMAPVASDVELVASELVTNTVLYSGTAGTMELINRDGFLRLRVSDGSSLPPVTNPAGMPPAGPLTSERGRGLPLVQLLSAAWGYLIDHSGSRKAVWATFTGRPRRR
jgi:hypothetical protein